MIKRIVTVMLAVALLAALALPAVADAFTLYVTKDGVKVYAKKDTGAKVYRRLSKGEKLLIEKKSGSWYAILVQDPSGDGQTLGWVQAKYLSTTKPSKEKKKKATQAPRATVSPQKEIDRLLDTMRDVTPYDARVVTKTERGTVALRRQPSTAGQQILSLMNGSPLRVLAEGEGWFRVSDPASGHNGYMSSKYIVRSTEVADDGDEDGYGDDRDAAAEAVDEAARDGGRTVAPIAVEVDVNHLPDGEYPVAFDRGDVARLASGTYMNAVHVCAVEVYADGDIENLAEGDSVVVAGSAIPVSTVTSEGSLVQINGGTGAADGCDFIRTADGNWRVNGFDDLPTYTELGVTTLVVDESAVFTDASDIDSDPVTAPYDGIVEAMQGAAFDGFYADNTTVTIRSGRVVRIDRVFVP